MEEFIVLQILTEGVEELQTEGEQKQFTMSALLRRQESVAVAGTHKSNVVGLQKLPFPVHEMDDRTGKQQNQFPEFMGVRHRSAGGKRVIVQIASAGNRGLLVLPVPADGMKRDLRAHGRIDEIVQFQSNGLHHKINIEQNFSKYKKTFFFFTHKL